MQAYLLSKSPMKTRRGGDHNRRMRSELPPNATNAHCHVFGPRARFPYDPNAPFRPEEDAPKDELIALNDRLGLQRCVVVQSACHGLDNRVTEDALAARPGSYRGIALLPTSVPEHELLRLDAAGFRGVRFNYSRHLGQGTAINEVVAFASRLAAIGWHLQIHGEPEVVVSLCQALKNSPVPVVIDHIGRIDASLGLDQPQFLALRELLRDERFWVKVSGIDRITRDGPPYADALPFAAQLVSECPDQVLWGNDWPHPNHAGPVPDEDALVDAIHRMAPSEEARQALLVDNPHRLYRFAIA